MSLSVSSIGNNTPYKTYNKDIKQRKNVAFSANSTIEDKTNNKKFDADIAAKNFIKGIISPITAIVKHPLATIGLVAGTAAACTLVPVLSPILALGFGAVGLYELGKSGYKIAKNIKNGDYDKAEQNFEGLGQGTINTVLSALGLKQGARVAKEAKMLESLNVKTLTSAQKEAIALESKSISYLDAAKEILSLGTKKGLKAVAYQFKPSMIKTRAKELIKFFCNKRVETTEKKIVNERFSETIEGQRRAAMTREEIMEEAVKLYNEAFDEYGIPNNLRPKLKIIEEQMHRGGGYNSATHTININETAYREGVFNLPDVIKHEATHATEALIREKLPQSSIDTLTKEYLLGKIQNGDNNTVMYNCGFLGTDTMTPPKMNTQMKADFIKLALEKLYKNNTKLNSVEELSAIVEPLVKSNPEFASQYANEAEAIKMLAQYAKSHQLRFFTNTRGTRLTLMPEQMQELKNINIGNPVESFKNSLECIDGNASNATLTAKFGLGGGDFDQYQFGAEEVMAQQRGNQFAIRHYEQELEALRGQANYNKDHEAYLLNAIEKAKKTIIYKTKGQEYYKLFLESQKHPENTKLAQQVVKMSKELEQMQNSVITKVEFDLNTNKQKVIIPLEKEVLVLKRVKPNLTIFVPYSTTSTADILASEVS